MGIVATFGFSTDSEVLLTETTPPEDWEGRVYNTDIDSCRSGQDNSMLMSVYGGQSGRSRWVRMREVKS